MEEKIKELEQEKGELEAKLSDLFEPEGSSEPERPGLFSNTEKMKELGQRLKELNEALEYQKKRAALEGRRYEAQEILRATQDAQLKALAEDELRQVEIELERLVRVVDKKSEEDRKSDSVIMEIRPGTGGEEAALFAAELVRMYQRFVERKGWNVVALEDAASELGGKKLVILEISGPGAAKLRFESGVHRVQRIPATEKSGRLHTSTATVAVLSKPAATELIIDPKDLEIDTMRSSGPGGQLVNRRESAVRVTHKPSGLSVTSQAARTQVANRENAISILRARLFELKQRESHEKQGAARRAQIGSGERAEKIRTYNFPQDRVTDHRLKKSWHNIAATMDGGLDKILST